jgi:DNA-binding NtrC family response regulator
MQIGNVQSPQRVRERSRHGTPSRLPDVWYGVLRMSARSDPVTVTQAKWDSDAEQPHGLVLTILDGPEKGRSYELGPLLAPRVLVGTSDACAIRLSDGLVSRRHCALDWIDGRLRVSDLRSTNGTSVDGVGVLEAFLREGQIVRIGDTVFHVDRREGNSPVAPPRSTATSFGRVIGGSAAMQCLYPLCERIAASTVPCIIEGETGTGKEILAESIHEQGSRAAGPFVVFDCTAVPPNLLEPVLFGHERGAHTGAMGVRAGVFEEAHGGTLLIDEIGELDRVLQPKLLRVVERSEVRRVGTTKPIRVDVRVLVATRRDLDREAQSGRFRDDLYHQLAVARIELPPLRQRAGDVERLARHFYEQLGLDPNAMDPSQLASWRDYAWPGNVRELRNAVTRYVALGETTIPGTDVPIAGRDIIEEILTRRLPLSLARRQVLDHFVRRYVARVLEEHGGNVAQAARASGIARRYLRKLKSRQK